MLSVKFDEVLFDPQINKHPRDQEQGPNAQEVHAQNVLRELQVRAFLPDELHDQERADAYDLKSGDGGDCVNHFFFGL